MKIAIDARWIFDEISGIGAYTRALIRNLATIDNSNEYLLIFNKESILRRTADETGIADKPGFKTALVGYGVFSLRGQLLMPGFLKKNAVDLFHSTNYMIPLPAFPSDRTGRTRCVATIHDVIPMIFPDHAPKSRKSRVFPIYKRLMIEIGRRTDLIIADSEASRRDVIKHLRIPENRADKVQTVYCGVSDRFTPPPPDSERKKTQVLYVGRIDPYKNVTTLVKAVAKARKDSGLPITLVIAGSPDPRYPEAQETARQLGISDSITWTGYLTDDELLSLYRESALLAHASRYEGFGLQIAEAMSCGTPVICSNAGSQPEVAGSAAVLLDPDDTDGFAANMIKVISDSSFAGSLSAGGIEQARGFTWHKTAEETLKIYESLS